MTTINAIPRWMLTVLVMAAPGLGCSMMPKKQTASSEDAVKALVAQNKEGASAAQAAASATPGSPEFSSGDELKNPIKVHLAYALWNEQEGNKIEARKSYDSVLKKQPKNIEALLGLARLDINLNRMSDAEEKLHKAQKIAPKSPEVAAALSNFYSVQQDWPRALEHMQNARRLSPYDPAYAHQLAIIQAKSGDLTTALSNFTEAVGAAEAHYNLAVLLKERGDVAAAEQHLEKALSINAELPQARRLLSSIREKQNESKNIASSPSSSHGTNINRGSIEPAAYSQPASR